MSDDLRDLVTQAEFESQFGVEEVERVSEGKLFGMTSAERMILSVILFLATAVFGIAVLLFTNTIALPR